MNSISFDWTRISIQNTDQRQKEGASNTFYLARLVKGVHLQLGPHPVRIGGNNAETLQPGLFHWLASLTHLSPRTPPPGVGGRYKSDAGNFGLVEKICRLSPLHLLGSPKTGTVLSWVALGLEKAKSQKKAPKAKTKKSKSPVRPTI